MAEQVDLDAMIAALRRGDGNGCRQPNEVMRAAADTLESTLAELRQERERADGLEANRRLWIADAFEYESAALSRAEETIERVRAWALVPRYKVSGDHDTFDTYHEGVDTAQGEAAYLITEYDKQKEEN